MSDIDAKELVARVREYTQKATPGPWTVFRCSYCDEYGNDPNHSACGLNGEHFDQSYDECHHPLLLKDAEFMANIRTDAEALCDVVDELLQREMVAMDVIAAAKVAWEQQAEEITALKVKNTMQHMEIERWKEIAKSFGYKDPNDAFNRALNKGLK